MVRKIVLTIVVLLLIVSAGYCQTQPLQLTIKSDKQVYEVGEPIYVDYQIRNLSNEDIKLVPMFSENNDIDPMQFAGDFILMGGRLKESVQVSSGGIYWPESSIGGAVVIKKVEFYSKKINILTIESQRYLKQPGKYMIYAKYNWGKHWDSLDMRDCWKGALVSNTITIEVKVKGKIKEQFK